MVAVAGVVGWREQWEQRAGARHALAASSRGVGASHKHAAPTTMLCAQRGSWCRCRRACDRRADWRGLGQRKSGARGCWNSLDALGCCNMCSATPVGPLCSGPTAPTARPQRRNACELNFSMLSRSLLLHLQVPRLPLLLGAGAVKALGLVAVKSYLPASCLVPGAPRRRPLDPPLAPPPYGLMKGLPRPLAHPPCTRPCLLYM